MAPQLNWRNTETNADIVGAVKKAGETGCYFLHTPMGRREKVGEVSDVVAFLASDAASFVTGAT